MPTKVCGSCKVEKSVEDFYRRYKGSETRSSKCKVCQKRWHNEHYSNNKETTKLNVKAYKQKLKEELRKLKSAPCTDCGNTYPYYVMQFDHLPQFDKIDDITRLVTRVSSSTLKEELSKCELVCANCHAIRTWTRRRGQGVTEA